MLDSKCWPVQQVILQACGASRQEIKVQREVFAVAVDTTDRLDGDSKAINICAWISRFLNKSRHSDQKLSGPLTTEEMKKQRIFWVKRAQKSRGVPDDYLQPNQSGILECRIRIQGMYPIYLLDKHLYTQKLVHHKDLQTLHGGVGLTMTSVRNQHWVPRLRKLAKRIIRVQGCNVEKMIK